MILDGRRARWFVLFALVGVAATGSRAYAPEGRAQAAEPVAPIHSYLTADDYPDEALAKEEQGTVEFLLTVGAEGQPTDCVVTNSSGSSSLDSASCLIMIERARFRPATNAAGKPVIGNYQNKITWRLEDSGSLQGLGASPAIDTATRLWFTCIWGEAAKLVPSELSPAEVTTRAFTACALLEERVALEMRKVSMTGMDPSKLIPNLKKEVEGKLPEMLDRARVDLKGE